MTTFRNFPAREAPQFEPGPRRFGRREPGALDEREKTVGWAGPVKLVAFVAGCAVLGALAAGVI